ncbi:MMPL family transporter [Streptomyces griseosporeus]|uniref:MMPL family transporter n=1 Tax=Streptomyces griseosporeus TaxID=1910 RepID=UPI00167EEFA9|nr:MMPL family transporter [Streptomyces griseosporeus]GHF46147.1 membrane protein [Streptomyces griseosporeus]
MHRRPAALVTRHPRFVLLAALGFLVLTVVCGPGAAALRTHGYDDPGADSAVPAEITAAHRGAPTDLVVVVRTPHGVDDPAARRAGTGLTRRLAAQRHVGDVSSYWTDGTPSLRGRDGRTALLLAHLDGDAEARGRYAERIRAALTTDPRDGLDVRVGGPALADAETRRLAAADLRRAEAVALPVTVALLVWVLGSLAAAALPLLAGVLATATGLLALHLLGAVTGVSVYAPHLTTVLGMGLGIAYGLLVVARFREHLTAGHAPREAARRTVATAGRTVVFSAATLCAALAGLLVLPPYALRSLACAGVAAVVPAAVAAVTLLPALLTLLGRRVNAGPVPGRRAARAGSASRRWESLAREAVRRPLLAALPALGLLALLAAPVAHAAFAPSGDRALPPAAAARQVGDLVRDGFDGRPVDALTVFTTSRTPETALDYAPQLSVLPDVAEVDGPSGVWRDGTRVAPPGPAEPGAPAILTVVPSADPRSDATQRLVRDIRRVPTPEGTDLHVTGPGAALADARDALTQRLPVAGVLIAGTTFVLLFLFSGSVLAALRAIVLGALSVAAALGTLVWAVQDGRALGLLPDASGPLDPALPVLLFCVLFGLSVHHTVCALARVQDARDAGQPAADASVTGVARTGGLVTSAGLLLAAGLLGLGTSRVAPVQLFGIGAGLGVLLDLALVRGLLVPALRLGGRGAQRPSAAGTPAPTALPPPPPPPPPPPCPPPPPVPCPSHD